MPAKQSPKRTKDGREILTKAQWRTRLDEVYRRDDGVCQICLGEIGREPWDVDHLEGRGLGGGTRDDRMENLQLTHAKCHRLVKHK
jgi:5-methylcytosine-specific restriction endonuclease McrA